MDPQHMLIAQAYFVDFQRERALRHECCAPAPKPRDGRQRLLGRLGIGPQPSAAPRCCAA